MRTKIQRFASLLVVGGTGHRAGSRLWSTLLQRDNKTCYRCNREMCVAIGGKLGSLVSTTSDDSKGGEKDWQ